MKNLLISLIISSFFLVVSGCSQQANKQPSSSGSTSEQDASGLQTNTAPAPSGDADHVSGTGSPSGSNISGN